MKKSVFVTVFALWCGSVFAQQLKEGSLDRLKGCKEIEVAFTYEHVMCGKMTEEKYVEYKAAEKPDPQGWKDQWYVKDRATCENMFRTTLAKILSDRASVMVSDNAPYRFVIDTYNLDPGFTSGVVDRGATIGYTCTVVDTASGESLAVIDMDKCTGTHVYDVGTRKAMAYFAGAKKLGKFLLKNKAF